MKLSDIYNIIKAKVDELTGHLYLIDRSPQVNFSDGRRGPYRYIRPARIAKERRSQGTPETTIEVEVGILSMAAKDADIAAAEDELDGLLNSLLRLGQIAPNVLIFAANTNPTQEQYLSTEGLDAEVPVIEAVATIAIRGYY